MVIYRNNDETKNVSLWINKTDNCICNPVFSLNNVCVWNVRRIVPRVTLGQMSSKVFFKFGKVECKGHRKPMALGQNFITFGSKGSTNLFGNTFVNTSGLWFTSEMWHVKTAVLRTNATLCCLCWNKNGDITRHVTGRCCVRRQRAACCFAVYIFGIQCTFFRFFRMAFLHGRRPRRVV